MSDRYELVNDLCPIAHLPAGHIADKLIDLGYVKQHRGTWIDLGDQRCQCSQCGSVRYGNSKEAIEKYHLAPFCEKCGANMTPSRIDITEECEKRHFCYQFPCDAEGGCIGKGKCIRTKEGTFMKNDQ